MSCVGPLSTRHPMIPTDPPGFLQVCPGHDFRTLQSLEWKLPNLCRETSDVDFWFLLGSFGCNEIF